MEQLVFMNGVNDLKPKVKWQQGFRDIESDEGFYDFPVFEATEDEALAMHKACLTICQDAEWRLVRVSE